MIIGPGFYNIKHFVDKGCLAPITRSTVRTKHSLPNGKQVSLHILCTHGTVTHSLRESAVIPACKLECVQARSDIPIRGLGQCHERMHIGTSDVFLSADRVETSYERLNGETRGKLNMQTEGTKGSEDWSVRVVADADNRAQKAVVLAFAFAFTASGCKRFCGESNEKLYKAGVSARCRCTVNLVNDNEVGSVVYNVFTCDSACYFVAQRGARPVITCILEKSRN